MTDTTNSTDNPGELPGPVATFMTFDETLDGLPDPNGHPNMVGEILPDDWTPDGDR